MTEELTTDVVERGRPTPAFCRHMFRASDEAIPPADCIGRRRIDDADPIGPREVVDAIDGKSPVECDAPMRARGGIEGAEIRKDKRPAGLPSLQEKTV
jgi:hypothetical protein